MPSKRKQKLREDALYENGGWFEVSTDFWLDVGEKPRKVRLLADAHFPSKLVEILRSNRIAVRTAQELRLHRVSDKQLLLETVKRGMTLITRDHDFLSDRKFPLHNSGKIVFVEGDGESIGDTTGFAILILLIRIWGSTKWYGKVRTTSDSLFLKFHGYDGRNRAYEFKMIPPLCAREIETSFE